MTAAYRLKGVGWFAGCTAVVLGFYLVSLQVAAERKRLETVDATIASTQRDIRALETEFDTRANLAQLERWNGDTLALSAPQARQFVRDEAQLASMDAREPLVPGGPEVKTAALVVPSLPTPGAMPVKPVAAPAQPAVAKPASAPAPAVVRMARAVVKAPATVKAAVIKVAARSDAPVAARPATLLRARPEVALLSDTTLGDLMSRARTERGRLR